jgi:peptide/nickel transport system permease protein
LGTYLVKRFLLMLLTLVGMSVVIFVLLWLMPGNIAVIMFDSAGFIDPAEMAAIEKELGLDLAIPLQYFRWVGGLLSWDLGVSFVSEMPVVDELSPRLPITAKLAALALAFSILFGLPLGVISAVRQNTWLDYTLRLISLSGLSLPSFWLALLILMFFVQTFGTIPVYLEPPESLWDELLLYAVPAAVVSFRASSLIMRLTRSAMLEVMGQDYIRTARAKGASNRAVNYRHALKNAMLPVSTIIGIEAAFMMGGLVVIETVFNIPGMAYFLVEAIQVRDYPIVQSLAMLMAVITVSLNFIVDMIYALLDPRIRYTE